MEDISRDLLKLKEIQSLAYCLAMHASIHGIKLDRAEIFFTLFNRLNHNLISFNQRWHTLIISQANTLQPIKKYYDDILYNYSILINAILQAWQKPMQAILQHQSLTQSNICKTLNDYDDAWLSALSRYQWKNVYHLENTQWDLLPLETSKILSLKHTYQNLKAQHRLWLFPKLIHMKSKIFKLRYDMIAYNQHISEVAMRDSLKQRWAELSAEFKALSEVWRDIPLLQGSLHLLEERLLKEYHILTKQYESLETFCALLLSKAARNQSSQHMHIPTIIISTSDNATYPLNPS